MAVIGAALGFVPAIAAASGHGATGTFVVASESCTRRTGCTWVGTFEASSGGVPGVAYQGSVPEGTGPGSRNTGSVSRRRPGVCPARLAHLGLGPDPPAPYRQRSGFPGLAHRGGAPEAHDQGFRHYGVILAPASATTRQPAVGTLQTYTSEQLTSPASASGPAQAYNLDFAGPPGPPSVPFPARDSWRSACTPCFCLAPRFSISPQLRLTASPAEPAGDARVLGSNGRCPGPGRCAAW